MEAAAGGGSATGGGAGIASGLPCGHPHLLHAQGVGRTCTRYHGHGEDAAGVRRQWVGRRAELASEEQHAAGGGEAEREDVRTLPLAH